MIKSLEEAYKKYDAVVDHGTYFSLGVSMTPLPHLKCFRLGYVRSSHLLFNPQHPKVFGVKFSLREIGMIFSIKKNAILSFEKCVNY